MWCILVLVAVVIMFVSGVMMSINGFISSNEDERDCSLATMVLAVDGGDAVSLARLPALVATVAV